MIKAIISMIVFAVLVGAVFCAVAFLGIYFYVRFCSRPCCFNCKHFGEREYCFMHMSRTYPDGCCQCHEPIEVSNNEED